MTWHLGTLCALDTETDGPDPHEARIVTACVAIIDGSGRTAPDVTSWVLKPVRPIPVEAAKIHGYDTARAEAEGIDPARGVKEIATRLGEATAAGVPIVAFNASFDLTVIDRELRRHRIGSIDPAGMRVIDPFVLDKAVDQYRKGSRTLTACCEHYGVRLDGAHDASFDAVAAARVAWRIAQRHPRIAGMGLDELHAFQVEAKREQDRSFAAYLRRIAATKRDVDEQIELNAKAEKVTGHWPVLPYEPQQEVIA
ncbi:exonuclease domain-containing protein [Spirillospora sp. CA-253888]